MTTTSPAQTVSAELSAERPSTSVVMAVADATDADPTELPPLYESVDPDALDRLFRPKPSGEARFAGHIAFRLADCEVVVDVDGGVAATPIESTDA